MAMEVWHHLQFTATWVIKMELAWQWSVTTVRAEHTCRDLNPLVVTHVTFITQERVSLSWRVLPESHHIVSSLSSTSVIIQWSPEALFTPGGCHVILLRWRTGVEHHPAVVSAHAGWPPHVQIPNMVVTVMQMTKYGVKTAVSSLTRHVCQLNSWGLGRLVLVNTASKVTTHWEN